MSYFGYEIELDAYDMWDHFEQKVKEELALEYVKDHCFGWTIEDIHNLHNVTKEEVEEFIEDNTAK